jgi:hypothetical protein
MMFSLCWWVIVSRQFTEAPLHLQLATDKRPWLSISNAFVARRPAVAQLIHFNNAGASLSPDVVTDAVLAHLQLEQRIGAYEAAAAAEADIENFYTAFATFLNCQRAEIGWAENATHAWNSVFHAVALQPGDRIVTGQSEYASNYLALLHLARQKQVHIDVVPNATNGQICLERLERAPEWQCSAARPHPCAKPEWRCTSGCRGRQAGAGTWHSLSAGCVSVCGGSSLLMSARWAVTC